MTVFQLKLLAIITMIIDHIGLFFFPQIIVFRIIGRISFPIFAWLIANGAYHTHNIHGYLIRLLLFAYIAQAPFFLANYYRDSTFSGLNVLFTLFFGLAAIFFIRRTTKRLLWVFIAIIFAGIAQFLNTDYGAMGVMSIIFFYIFFNNKIYLVLSQIIVYLSPFLIWATFLAKYDVSLVPQYMTSNIEPLAIVSLIFLLWHNKKEGLKAKYLFYVFYPLQYVIIIMLQRLLKY